MKTFIFLALFLGLLITPFFSAHAKDLIAPNLAAKYRERFPKVLDPVLEEILKSPDTILYDSEAIIPGYQDSMGGPKGFRPNTIDSSFINLAVPGGWQRLFFRKGLFHFPFGTGGVDLSDNVVKINFWLPPKVQGQVIPVAFWKSYFSRTHWVFPFGTQLGEILFVKFTDGEIAVFEIRLKTRTPTGWTNDVYRPFLNPAELALSIQNEEPQWNSFPSLVKMMQHLSQDVALTPRPLESRYYPGTFSEKKGALDILPDFGQKDLVQKLLTKTPFKKANGTFWRRDNQLTTYAASTHSENSIVPKEYDAGVFPVTDESCNRCHDQGGRQIRDFYDELMLYGELWGEDQIFSWHLFETSAFLKPDGSIKNFNDDNRRIRKDLLDAGLVKQIEPSKQSAHFYKELPKNWKYKPVRKPHD